MQKKKSQEKHAKIRAFERYGLTLNKSEMQQLASQVKKNKAKAIKQITNRVSLAIVTWKDIDYPVIYDRMRKTIVTFLPERYLKKLPIQITN